jgi:hypothetical protein
MAGAVVLLATRASVGAGTDWMDLRMGNPASSGWESLWICDSMPLVQRILASDRRASEVANDSGRARKVRCLDEDSSRSRACLDGLSTLRDSVRRLARAEDSLHSGGRAPGFGMSRHRMAAVDRISRHGKIARQRLFGHDPSRLRTDPGLHRFCRLDPGLGNAESPRIPAVRKPRAPSFLGGPGPGHRRHRTRPGSGHPARALRLPAGPLRLRRFRSTPLPASPGRISRLPLGAPARTSTWAGPRVRSSLAWQHLRSARSDSLLAPTALAAQIDLLESSGHPLEAADSLVALLRLKPDLADSQTLTRLATLVQGVVDPDEFQARLAPSPVWADTLYLFQAGSELRSKRISARPCGCSLRSRCGSQVRPFRPEPANCSPARDAKIPARSAPGQNESASGGSLRRRWFIWIPRDPSSLYFFGGISPAGGASGLISLVMEDADWGEAGAGSCIRVGSS